MLPCYTALHSTGKSTLLTAIGAREIPIPNHTDIFHLTEEMAASDKTPLQCVLDVDQERWEGGGEGGREGGRRERVDNGGCV